MWVLGRLVVIAPEGEPLMRIAILSLGLLAAVGAVRADEETIGLKDLPKAVRAAVKAKFEALTMMRQRWHLRGGKPPAPPRPRRVSWSITIGRFATSAIRESASFGS